MKKILYLCIMLALSTNTMAQIDPNDHNWDTLLLDYFTNNSWNTWKNWLISNPDGYYKAFIPEWPSGVSRGYSEHQVYQRENCLFDNNGEFRLISFYEGGVDALPLQCGDYDIPPGKTCDTSHHTLFYTSGKIETGVKYLYGYFEIKCSLPIHKGSFPAFWLYGQGTNYYNEIDIFEYSWGVSHDNHYKQFTCGVFCNNESVSLDSYARTYPVLPNSSTDLHHMHTFACEWLPERITWYVDGIIVNEFSDYDHIPHHEMALKVNYAIDNYALHYQTNLPDWRGSDEMSIDYVKVLQLKTNCDTDVLINSIQDLTNFQPSIKQSIKIEPSSELIIPVDLNINMRAVDSIVIGNNFTLLQGAQMVLQTQLCPE